MIGDSDGGPPNPPPYQMATWAVLGAAFVLVLGLFSIRCAHGPTTSRAYAGRSLPPEPEPVLLDREMTEPMYDYWPCSDCHADQTTNPTPRELEEDHEGHTVRHGDLWCLDCHDPQDRDRLHLADGQRVAFEESWKLCTQCHGAKLSEWRRGIHGKRTGHWWGPKEFRTCVECHNPHDPPFQPPKPLPSPKRPAHIYTGAGDPDYAGPSLPTAMRHRRYLQLL